MNALALLNNALLVLYNAVVLIVVRTFLLQMSVYQSHWAGRLNVFEKEKL